MVTGCNGYITMIKEINQIINHVSLQVTATCDATREPGLCEVSVTPTFLTLPRCPLSHMATK